MRSNEHAENLSVILNEIKQIELLTFIEFSIYT